MKQHGTSSTGLVSLTGSRRIRCSAVESRTPDASHFLAHRSRLGDVGTGFDAHRAARRASHSSADCHVGTISNRPADRLTADEFIASVLTLDQHVQAEAEQFANVASSDLTLDQVVRTRPSGERARRPAPGSKPGRPALLSKPNCGRRSHAGQGANPPNACLHRDARSH